MLSYEEIIKLQHDYLPNTRIVFDGDENSNPKCKPNVRGTIKHINDFGEMAVLLDNGTEIVIDPQKNKFKLLPIDEQIQEAEVKKEEIIASKHRKRTRGYHKETKYRINEYSGDR